MEITPWPRYKGCTYMHSSGAPLFPPAFSDLAFDSTARLLPSSIHQYLQSEKERTLTRCAALRPYPGYELTLTIGGKED